jgi:cysteine desulfurase
MNNIQFYKSVYLDNNGTTRIFDEALGLMNYVYQYYFGNASAIYKYGAKSKQILEMSRVSIANVLSCQNKEIYFTSGATESNNILIRGVYNKNKGKGKHVITTNIEHPSVYETVKSLEGVDITFLKVDKYGLINLHELASSIRDDTVLVTIIMGNNEIGTLQDVRSISDICKKRNVHFHCDMTQVIGKYIVDLKALGVSSACASGHKFHGPKSTGFLYITKGAEFESCMSGGHQEHNMRSGTENIPGIVSMSYALNLCHKMLANGQHKTITQMRDWMKQQLLTNIPGTISNGHPEKALYNTLSLCLPLDSRKLIEKLDKVHISINTGSACSKGASSRILDAIGVPAQAQKGSIRVSFGFLNDWNDCMNATKYIIYYSKTLMR